jgi:hypothetical protein
MSISSIKDLYKKVIKEDPLNVKGWLNKGVVSNKYSVKMIKNGQAYLHQNLIGNYCITSKRSGSNHKLIEKFYNKKLEHNIDNLGFKITKSSNNYVVLEMNSKLNFDLNTQLLDAIEYIQTILPNSTITHYYNKNSILRIKTNNENLEISNNKVLIQKTPNSLDSLINAGLWDQGSQVSNYSNQNLTFNDLMTKSVDMNSLKNILKNNNKTTQGEVQLVNKHAKISKNLLGNYSFINIPKKSKNKILNYIKNKNYELKINKFGFKSNHLNEEVIIIKPNKKLKIEIKDPLAAIKELDSKTNGQHSCYYSTKGPVFFIRDGQNLVEFNKDFILYANTSVSTNYVETLLKNGDLWV